MRVESFGRRVILPLESPYWPLLGRDIPTENCRLRSLSAGNAPNGHEGQRRKSTPDPGSRERPGHWHTHRILGHPPLQKLSDVLEATSPVV